MQCTGTPARRDARQQGRRFAALISLSLSLLQTLSCAHERAGRAATMTATPAPSPVLGRAAPDFSLRDLDGNEVSLASFRGRPVVLEWFNPLCPFVVRAHTRGSLVEAARRHAARGVVWLAINSGAPGRQGHALDENRAGVQRFRIEHPILRDETGAVGHAYGATNTPNMFVIDPTGTVVYAGAIDNSPDGEGATPTGGTLVNFVDEALADVAAGRLVRTPQTRPYGCSVKYAP